MSAFAASLVGALVVALVVLPTLWTLHRQLSEERRRTGELLDRLAAKNLAEYQANRRADFIGTWDEPPPAPRVHDETGLFSLPAEPEE